MRAPTSILPVSLRDVIYVAGGRVIIDRVSFELTAGPRTVILGANGAGKSVLMRLMHGLLKPATGTIAWQGENPARKQAMVFQRPVLLRRSARTASAPLSPCSGTSAFLSLPRSSRVLAAPRQRSAR